jgi:hypothetical protein
VKNKERNENFLLLDVQRQRMILYKNIGVTEREPLYGEGVRVLEHRSAEDQRQVNL